MESNIAELEGHWLNIGSENVASERAIWLGESILIGEHLAQISKHVVSVSLELPGVCRGGCHE